MQDSLNSSSGKRQFYGFTKNWLPADSKIVRYLYIATVTSLPAPCGKCLESYSAPSEYAASIENSADFEINENLLGLIRESEEIQNCLLLNQGSDNFSIIEMPLIPYPSCRGCKGKGQAESKKFLLGKRDSEGQVFLNAIGKSTFRLDQDLPVGSQKNITIVVSSFICTDSDVSRNSGIDYSFGVGLTEEGALTSARYEGIERFYTFCKQQIDPVLKDISAPENWQRKIICNDGDIRRLDYLPSNRSYICSDIGGKTELVPEEQIYCNTWDVNSNLYLSSSGCAVGSTLMMSRMAAGLELLERHFLLKSWLTGDPGLKIANNSIRSRDYNILQDICTSLDLEIHIVELSQLSKVSVIHVVLLNKEAAWPAASMGSAAKATQSEAIIGALKEGILNYILQKRRGPKGVNLSEISSEGGRTHPILHNHFYGLAENTRYLDFWIKNENIQASIIEDKKINLDLVSLDAALRKEKISLYYADLQPDFMCDYNIFVTRCVSPDVIHLTFEIGAFYVPVSFDKKQIRSAVFDIPHPFC